MPPAMSSLDSLAKPTSTPTINPPEAVPCRHRQPAAVRAAELPPCRRIPRRIRRLHPFASSRQRLLRYARVLAQLRAPPEPRIGDAEHAATRPTRPPCTRRPPAPHPCQGRG